MAGVCSRVLNSCWTLARALRTTAPPSVPLSPSLVSSKSSSLPTGRFGLLFCRSTLYRSFSWFSSVTSSCTQSMTLRHKPPLQMVCAPPVVPVRTVVKHSKLGKMKTVKAVAKRFRRTGSGKLKFWPPGNTHNLLSKSHDRKCRIRKARYVNKTQLKTLNKMLIGRYS